MAIKNLQGKVKNLKAELYILKKSGHSGGASSANKKNFRITPNWEREGQPYHPTWWSTTYCWSHGAGGHACTDFKNKRPGHKSGPKVQVHCNNKYGRQHIWLVTVTLMVRFQYK